MVACTFPGCPHDPYRITAAGYRCIKHASIQVKDGRCSGCHRETREPYCPECVSILRAKQTAQEVRR